MRTLGSLSVSTVASAIASGSLGSAFLASSNQAANSRNGSSASVKSPLLNQVGCSIGTVSDIIEGFLVTGCVPGPAHRVMYRGLGYNVTAGPRLWWALRQVLRRAIFIAAIALLADACSMPAKFGLFGRDDRTDSFNSISVQSAVFSNTDLAVASASTTALLEHDGA